ncbi:RIP metalloprotease RseP [Halodesulfovibrio marinisediminis]|uniref:Zinc metalloprotease n=1 Tax=Halodesulfovibrio marinisediminis DSM 17456 TaxID=1121457 RepID=A0A1N6HGF9_9BACT|nr:RIP metalloprotease RseP [Halodesulfovibrio marinisediminis]SIO18842.1 regulator of sigma E protease [Halodesulfovibrio marinisediminis DSM 17456]
MLSSAIAIILVLGGLIFFHELGHFSVARAFGVGIRTFSLGFGPAIYKFKRGRTEYRLSAVPLGGYVSMVGENPDDDINSPENIEFSEADSFIKRKPWQRLCIVAAGPIANLLLSFFIYWALFIANGQPQLIPEIGSVRPDSPAAVAGLKQGDSIKSISGNNITSWEDVYISVAKSEGKELQMVISRDGNTLTFDITPSLLSRKSIFGEEEQSYLIGILASGKTEQIDLGFFSSASAAFEKTWSMTVLTVQGFVKLIERVVPAETVGGPIMIAQLVSKQAEQGLVAVLALAALISINLGVLNLLPIPVLDGGHIVMLVYEMIVGKPVPAKVMDYSIRVGIFLLLTLMVWATFNDVRRL